MATRAALARALRIAKADHAGRADAELLRLFAENDDQAAFAAIVGRHSAMVLGVCQRVLHNQQDAEDACQAVFLVLARKAGSVRWGASVANWLFSTARKVAHNARLASARRGRREAVAAVPEAVPPGEAMTSRELVAALDDELDKLPPRYREPLVLCYLEGLTRDEAAARLGVPVATLKGQLERGRKKLGDALTARGCALGVALLVTAATSTAGASSPRLLGSILAAVGGSPSPAVSALAQGVAVKGLLNKAVLGIAAVVAVMGVAVGWGRISQVAARTETGDTKRAVGKGERPAAKEASLPAPEKAKVLVLDAAGKPVAGATVRRVKVNKSGGVTEKVLGKTDAKGRFEAEVVRYSMFTAVAEKVGTAWGYPRENGGELTLKMAKPLPIKGRLVDLQGKAIPHAKVAVVTVGAPEHDDLTGVYNALRTNAWASLMPVTTLSGAATGAPAGTTTDKDGRFELNNVGRDHVVVLRFQADGIETRRVTVVADPEFAKRMKAPTDAERQRNRFALQHKPAVYGPKFTHAAQPEHLLKGTVVDSDTGKPVKGVTVRGTTVPVYPTVFNNPAWGDAVSATTDDKGRFTLRGLAKAVVWDMPFLPKEKRRYLHVQADGTPYLDTVAIVPDTADYTPATVEVKLRPAVIVKGSLVNKATGKPVRGSAQWFGLTANEALANGDDPVSLLYKRRYGSTHPGGTSAEADDRGRFELRVPPGPGVIFAGARDGDPTAVFTAARVRKEDRKYLRPREKEEGRVPVGPRERYDDEVFATLGLTWFLRWENDYAIINPGANDRSVAVKMTFDPGASVKLAVTGPDGKPLTGVTLIGPGPYGELAPTFPTAEITLGGLDPKGQPQQFYLLHKERKLCAELKARGDEKKPISVKLSPCASVTGRVVDHNGMPVAKAVVAFQMEDYHTNNLLRKQQFRGPAGTRTDKDGKFTFERMFPGVAFHLFVSLPGHRTGTGHLQGVKLKSGEAKDVGAIKLRDPKRVDNE